MQHLKGPNGLLPHVPQMHLLQFNGLGSGRQPLIQTKLALCASLSCNEFASVDDLQKLPLNRDHIRFLIFLSTCLKVVLVTRNCGMI